MQRIHRQTDRLDVAGSALQGYEQLQALLVRLPASVRNTFAQPRRAADGAIEWYSPLDGQPVPLALLDATQVQAVRLLLAERLQSVANLADGAEQGDADLLRHAAALPGDDGIFVVNGQPVITAWSMTPLPDSRLVVPQAAAETGRGLWPWLLALLLLALLLLAGIWWLWWRPLPEAVPELQPPPEIVSEPESRVEPVPEPEPEPEPAPAPAPTPTPAPSDPYALLVERIESVGKNCSKLMALRQEPLLRESTEQAKVMKAGLEKKVNGLCHKQMIQEARRQCPGVRSASLAPEVVIVFDASGSMELSLLNNAQENERGLHQDPDPRLYREPRRITAARRAAMTAIKQLPGDMRTGLVLVENCPQARSAGFFSPTQRKALLQRIEAINPVGKTPLADGLSKAAQMVDGVNREALILLISDGDETCHGDPCAVATQLARSKPLLKVNVVDILGTGAGNCVAKATGGKVFTADTVEDVSRMTQQAIQDYVPKGCR